MILKKLQNKIFNQIFFNQKRKKIKTEIFKKKRNKSTISIKNDKKEPQD